MLTDSTAFPEIRQPYKHACPTCPWRVACQQHPPLDKAWPERADEVFYTEDGRRLFWADWLGLGQGAGDGFRISCHRFPPQRWCAGADALQHRALLRWFETGRLGSLTEAAPARIAAELLNYHPWQETTPAVDWLLDACRPGIVDPEVAFLPLVEAPSADELTRWTAAA